MDTRSSKQNDAIAAAVEGRFLGLPAEMIYLFVVWFGLVLVAALMAPGLAGESAEDEGEER